MSWLGAVGIFLVLWLAMYVLLLAFLAAFDHWLVEPFERRSDRRRDQRQLCESVAREIAGIELQATSSVQRIEAAYRQAQQLIRDEARRSRP